MRKILGLIAVMLFVSGSVYAGPPVDKNTSWDAGDALVVDKSSPAAYKMQIGTRLYGPIGIVGSTTYSSSQLPTQATASYATPTTKAFFVTTGAADGSAYYLGDGVNGQTLTIVLTTDGGKDLYVTPKTKTGFSNVQLNDANDSVTLEYQNDTDGWIVKGNNGATVN